MTRSSILIAIALFMALFGCRLATKPTSEIAPDRDPTPPAVNRAVLPADEDWVPLLQRLDVRIAGPFLMVIGLLEEHAPVPFNGGWSLQMLLDTDQRGRETGIGFGTLGIDYVVRGPERQPDGSLLVRIAQGEDGEWGREVGTARFVETGRTFSIAVPLRVIQDDGALDWVFYTASDRVDLRQGSCSPPYSLRTP